jgi:hypothetical protein
MDVYWLPRLALQYQLKVEQDMDNLDKDGKAMKTPSLERTGSGAETLRFIVMIETGGNKALHQQLHTIGQEMEWFSPSSTVTSYGLNEELWFDH